jgi:GNAT superfamily N-acetyltransferase
MSIESVPDPRPASPKTSFSLRKATRADAEDLVELILALAEFEKLTPPDAAGQMRLIEHGFGERPRYEAWLAFCEGESKPAGYALFFETYSSFCASPTLYLEDIFVRPDRRGRGIGSALLRLCVGIARERGCSRMEWTCLDWNTRAQEVYNCMGAARLSEWFLYRMTRLEMETFLSRENASPA